MKRFVSATAVAVLTLVAVPHAKATEHNPGDPGHSVELGKIDHQCAGRKLLYHSHNDALYGTYKNGKLTVMAVDGQQVTDQEKVCFRLAPDADADGNDVSTLTVPEDGSLDFLGEPGSKVWAAPQSVDWTDSWRPIWSGLGAFDPAHESGEIPDNFVDDVMHFDLVEMDGPGDVNVFFSSRVGDPERLFSSADEDMRTITYEVGGHGHFTWTFSEPGIYEMTWQGRAELEGGGTERSEPVTQYWLVGDDATVGLPEGTTTDLRTPNTAQDTANPSTSATPSLRPKPSPSTRATPAPRPTAPAEAAPTSTAPADRRKLITSGHMDMALVAEGPSISAKLIDDSDFHNQAQRESGSFIFAVPDAARKTLPVGARESFPDAPEEMWILPQAQQKNLPWLGFSTTRVAADALAQGSKVTVALRDVDGPGRIYTWHEDLRGLRMELDSADPDKTLEYPVNAHDHQGFGFTEPGVYTATFTFSGTSADGEDFSEDMVATFAVGDEAVTAAREGRLGGADAAAGAGKGSGKLTLPGALADGIRSLEREIKKAGDTLTPLARKKDNEGDGGSGGSVAKSGSASGSAARPAATPKQPQSVAAPAVGQPAPAPAAQPQRASSNNRASRSETREDAKVAKPSATTKAKAPSEASSATTDSAGTSESYAAQPNPAGGSGTGIDSSLDAAAAQPVGQTTDTSPTAGGFWAGLAIGVGVMALIGGCVLFVAAVRLLRRVEQSAS